MSVQIFVNGYWVQLPLNNVEFNGSLNYTIEDATASVTLASASNYVFADASSADIVVNLPAAATAKSGRLYNIKKTDSSANKVTVDGDGSETIDGDTTFEILQQDESVTIVCDGSNWYIV